MYWYGWSLFGMNLLWWIFWIILLIAFFALLTPVPRGRAREWRDRDTPLRRLQQRYAEGQLSTAEYEERRAVLERDRGLSEGEYAEPRGARWRSPTRGAAPPTGGTPQPQ